MNELLHLFLGAFCHQLPEHSLTVYGAALPLCARCTGLHLAAAATLLYLQISPATRHRTGLPTGAAARLLIGAAALWLLDGVNSTASLFWGAALYPPTNALRIATGLGVGLGVGMCLGALLHDALSRAPVSLPIAQRGVDLLGPLSASAASVGLVALTPWAEVRALLLALAAFASLAVSNGLVIVALVPALRTRRRDPRRWFAPLGLAAALLEIVLLSLLRGWLSR